MKLHELYQRAAAIEAPDGGASEAALKLINALGLPRAATADELIVRAALVANNLPDAYDTVFSDAALEQVAGMLPGNPLMRNHVAWEAEALPVGRWFDAAVVEIDGVRWVRASFYMARDPEGESLVRRMDTGIVREVSLAWWVASVRCNICGRDLRDDGCAHLPGELYDGRKCLGVMQEIASVDECSLVWKGGQFGTKIMADERAMLVQRLAAKRGKQRPGCPPGESLEQWFNRTAAPSAELVEWFKAG